MASDNFDPDAYLKQKEETSSFDPDSYLESKLTIPKPSKPEMGPISSAVYSVGQAVESIPEALPSALKGAEQGTTFGFADELGGAIGAGLEGLSPTSQLPEESKLDYIQRMYAEYRDAARNRYKQAEEANPVAYMAGDIAGGFLLPGAAAKGLTSGAQSLGAKSLAKIGAGVGAATGALEGAGRTEADLFSEEGTIDAATGAALGGTIGGIAGKIGSKFTPQALQDAFKKAAQDANISGLKAIGATGSDFADELKINTSKRGGLGSAKGTGTTLIDQNVLKLKQSPAELKDAIVAKMDEVATKQMSPTAKKLDELSKNASEDLFDAPLESFAQNVAIDAADVANSARYAKASDAPIYDSMAITRDKVFQDVESALNGSNPIEALVNIKRQIQSQINWGDTQSAPYNQYLSKIQSHLNGLIDGMSQQIDPQLAQQMKNANKTYSNLINANDIAGKSLAKDIAEDSFSPSFTELMGANLISNISNTPIVGPLGIAAKRGVEKVTGKDLGKLVNTIDSFRSAKKAPQLAQRAANYGGRDAAMAGGTLTAAAPAALQAVTDVQRPEQPYEKTKNMSSYIEKSSPEQIQSQANNVRQQYGKDGERLATQLDKLSAKDEQGRKALLFGIMQDPSNRKMLGID